MTKVLIVRYLGYYDGGIEAYINAMVPHLVSAGIEPVVLTCGSVAPHQLSYLESHGVSVIEGDVLDPGLVGVQGRLEQQRRVRALLDRVLQGGGFDALHVNCSAPGVQADAMKAGLRAGVPVRIAHGHDDLGPDSPRNRVSHEVYQRTIDRCATKIAACSAMAGRYLVGSSIWARRGEVARNGIEVERFAFNARAREDTRAEFGDGFVVGLVGRLDGQKNPLFAIDVLELMHRTRTDASLWLVGEGGLRQAIEARAAELGLGDCVRLLGQRRDVPRLLSGMDCLIAPSTHEGLNIAAIEAQAAGLPCVVSDRLPAEVDVPGCTVVHLGLSDSAALWADTVLAQEGSRTEGAVELVRAAGYDVADTAAAMAAWYRGA